MNDDLARRIREHVTVGQHRTIPFPPATQDAADDAEAALGFPIPQLLKWIYLTVGNGGFGPGRGGNIIGLRGGDASSTGNLVAQYDDIRGGAEYLGRDWPARLLPFCEWGCNIFSCVDCGDPSLHVYLSEECVPRPQGYTLAEFMEMWLNGVDLLEVNRTPSSHRDVANPFTRNVSTVYGRRRK